MLSAGETLAFGAQQNALETQQLPRRALAHALQTTNLSLEEQSGYAQYQMATFLSQETLFATQLELQDSQKVQIALVAQRMFQAALRSEPLSYVYAQEYFKYATELCSVTDTVDAMDSTDEMDGIMDATTEPWLSSLTIRLPSVCALVPLIETMAERYLINEHPDSIQDLISQQRQELVECGCTVEMMTHSAMREQYPYQYSSPSSQPQIAIARISRTVLVRVAEVVAAGMIIIWATLRLIGVSSSQLWMLLGHSDTKST